MVDETQSFALLVNRYNPNDRKVQRLAGFDDDFFKIMDEKKQKSISFAEITEFDKLRNFNQIQNELISFKPPHNYETRVRLGNMYETDPYLQAQLKYFTQYKFGRKIKQRVIPLEIDTPTDRRESDDMVDDIVGKKKHREFKKFIAKVDEISDIYDHMRRGDIASTVYGTAAMWKTQAKKRIYLSKSDITIPVGTPVAIKPINAFQLGHIWQDRESFEPKYYEYNNQAVVLKKYNVKGYTNPKDKSDEMLDLVYREDLNKGNFIEGNIQLPFERLILLDRDNPGVTPDTYYYGMSPLVGGIPISDNIRKIDQKIYPEVNETQYAPVIIFQVDKDSMYNLDQLAKDLSVSGNKIVVNSDVTPTVVPMNNAIDSIGKEKEGFIKNWLMITGIPDPLFNQQGSTARASLELILNIWQNTKLEDERKFIADAMWWYWYRELMQVFFKGETYLDLEIKVVLEFENRKFTPFVDIAKPLTEAFTQNLLSRPEWRRTVDFADFSENPEDNTRLPSLAQQQIDMQKEQLEFQKQIQKDKLAFENKKLKVDERMSVEREKTSRIVGKAQAENGIGPNGPNNQGPNMASQQKGVNNKTNNTQERNKKTGNAKAESKTNDNKNS